MKAARNWVTDMRADPTPGSIADDLQWIRRIQADALRWALEQVVPDGNLENVSAKIRAKLTELQ